MVCPPNYFSRMNCTVAESFMEKLRWCMIKQVCGLSSPGNWMLRCIRINLSFCFFPRHPACGVLLGKQPGLPSRGWSFHPLAGRSHRGAAQYPAVWFRKRKPDLFRKRLAIITLRGFVNIIISNNKNWIWMGEARVHLNYQ